MSLIPAPAVAAGFLRDGTGAHTSRTVMLKELTQLFVSCPASATVFDYRYAILDDNVLSKQSASTRRATYR